MKTLIFHFFQISFLLLLTACVGTIEKTKSLDNSTEVNTGNFNFAGAYDATGISHDKILVRFKPASGGSNRFNYQIFQNGSEVPVASIDGENTTLDFEGYINATISGLSKGQSYSYQVTAFDKQSGLSDANQIYVTGTTYANNVPIFDGAIAVENLAGLAGETQLKIKWNTALPSTENFNPFVSDPNAISGYNVYAGTSAGNVTLKASITDPDETEYILTGLTPGVTYFVNVKAKDSNTPVREDGNQVYIPRATRTADAINFSGINYIALSTTPNANVGFSNINIAWAPGTGSFDRYRLFVSSTPKTAFNPLLDSPHLAVPAGDITDLNQTSITINVTLPNTLYYVALVACRDVTCAQFQGQNVVKTITTRPPVAPFNGITTIAAPAGLDSLTSVQLTWDAPDLSSGVADEVRIFLSDASGVYNALTDRVNVYNPATPSIPGIDMANSSSTSARIAGLTTDTQYCFVAKAYNIAPFDALNPLGRTHTNSVVRCHTPSMVSPGFGGVNNLCTNHSSTGFDISWSTPNPVGTFSYFEIYYKVNDGTFNFNDAVSVPYTTVIATSDKTSHAFTNLSPSTSYQIGIRTYFLNPVSMLESRDANLSIATCSTLPAKVIMNGWTDLIALGPKRNGIDNQLKLESFTTHKSVDAVDGFYKNKYPRENPLGTQGVNASNQGMVFIAWEDFSLSGSIGNMQNFAGVASGYNIYRKAWTAAHDITPPTLLNDFSVGPWVKLNTDIIQPEAMTYQGSARYVGLWTDYNFDRTTLLKNEAKIYFYKVEAVMNGVPIEYDSSPADGIIKVILPPENMSFVSRWMANKAMCEELLRTPDRTQNYSCVYDGIGSTLAGRYDIEKNMLYDRFEMGVNFTRGNEGGGCSSVHALFEGTGLPGTNTIAGDCIAFNTTALTSINANRNAVIYLRNYVDAYINTSAVYGNTWSLIFTREPTTTHESASIFPLNHASHPVGTGLGAIVSSNEAGLPPHGRMSASMAHHVCKSFDVIVGGSTYLKRTPRKKEFMVSASRSPYMTINQDAIISATSVTPSGAAIDRDCNTSSTKYGATTPASLDLRSNAYPYVSYSVTGSSGAVSSEGCVSRFGIQDLTGNINEAMSDTAFCNTAWGCTFAFTDNTETTPITPLMDSGARETVRNGDGTYFNTYIGTGMGYYMVDAWISSATYVSPVLGFGLMCQGSYCNNGNDDNLRFSMKSAALVPSAEVNNYRVGYNPIIDNAYGARVTHLISGVTTLSFLYSGGGINSDYSNRYSYFVYAHTTLGQPGRCMTPVDE